jgi:hypothetical protein
MMPEFSPDAWRSPPLINSHQIQHKQNVNISPFDSQLPAERGFVVDGLPTPQVGLGLGFAD